MGTELIERGSLRIVHVTSTDKPIRARQDALDVMVGHGYADVAGIAIDETCFDPDFFRLKTGIAGELLQIFVNYRIRVAILGDFSKYPGDTLRAFIAECNRGQHIFFVDDVEEAIRYFSHHA